MSRTAKEIKEDAKKKRAEQQQAGNADANGAKCNSQDLQDLQDEPWGKPFELGENVPVAAFPQDVFPEPALRLIAEAAVALPCPPDYVGVSLIGMASGMIGASRALSITRSHTQPAVVYAGFVARPGERKSASLNAVTGPAFARDEISHAAWNEEVSQYDLALEVWEKAKKEAVKDGRELPTKPKRPTLKRLIVVDATTHALQPILQENPRGVILVRDELSGWVTSMNEWSDGDKGSDRQFWLSCWSCETAVIDRKGTHEKGPIRIPHPFIGVIGTTQPDKLPLMRGDRKGQRGDDDGFIDRILLSWPDPVPARGETWDEIAGETVTRYRDMMDRLMTLQMEPKSEGSRVVGFRPWCLKLDESGRRAWEDFTTRHAAEMNAGDFPSHLRGPWSKMTGYCGRLALIVHLLRWAACEFDDDQDGKSDVTGEDVRRAARLIDYFKSHARRVHTRMDRERKLEKARKVWAWVVREKRTEFKKWEPYEDLKSESDFPDPDSVDQPLQVLESHNLIRVRPTKNRPGPGRKPAPVYDVNPQASSCKSCKSGDEVSDTSFLFGANAAE